MTSASAAFAVFVGDWYAASLRQFLWGLATIPPRTRGTGSALVRSASTPSTVPAV